MAADTTQISESTKHCMAKIDKIIEDALGNESSGTGSRKAHNMLVETKGMVDFSPSASPVRKPTSDVSKIIFSPTRENYHSNKSSSSLSGIANSESPLKRYEYEAKPSDKDSLLSNTTKESRFTSISDISDNWVNYQFERLVADKKNNVKSKTTNEFSSNVPHVAKVKNVEEILREYSSNDSLQGKNYYPGPQSFSMSSARNSNLYKVGLMNRSHNNETLNSANPEMEQMRRVGSSVDGDVGDVLKSFGAKCSLSGTRCSTSQMLDAEENKSLGLPRDSEVDFKPPPNSSGRIELSEIRTDLSDLNYSFQKERERLRHLETLIRKTPAGSSSGPEVIHTLKSHNYSSRFLNEYTGRKAFSVTDYSKYGGSDWRSSPPQTTDYIGRASSAMSYRNVGLFSPTSRTNYMSDYNPSQYTSTGFESARVPSLTTQRHESHEHETEPMSQSTYNYNNYPKPSGSASLNKTKLNRSYNAKKDRNMSKSLNETQTTRRKNSFIKSFNIKKSSPSETRRYFDNRDNKHERQWLNLKTENKSRNKFVSPNSSSISDVFRGDPKKDTRSKYKLAKYQPYQPRVTQQEKCTLKRTKSENSNLNTMLCTNQLSGPRGIEQSDAECDPQRTLLSTSLFPSDSVPCPEAECINEMTGKVSEANQQHTSKCKRGKVYLRSTSECRVPNNNASLWQHPDHFASGNNTIMLQSQGQSAAKTYGRKLKPKAKKGICTGVKQKKKSIAKQK